MASANLNNSASKRTVDDPFLLTQAQRDAITKTLPDEVCPLPAWWDKLEMAIELYFAMAERRILNPPLREAKRWRHIEELVRALASELIPTDAPDLDRWISVLRDIKAAAEPARIGMA
jgi:hypothetical protein